VIDFRYHLVSIASIFLALAVGIVLGAGPLKGTIGDTLTSEVTRLRDDANALRADLSAAEARAAAHEELITELGPRAVSGLLSGESVSMLALPGASDQVVEETRALLLQAGASVSTQVRLEPTFTSVDPPAEADRREAAAQLREAFASNLPIGASAEEVISVAVGWAMTTQPDSLGASDGTGDGPGDSTEGGTDDPGDSSTDAATTSATPGADGDDDGPDPQATEQESSDNLTPGVDTDRLFDARADERGRQILDILESNGLLAHSSDGLLGSSGGVVVIAPEADEGAAPDVTQWAELIGSLAEASAVTVVGEVGEEVLLETNLIATVRDDGALSGRVSTIDNVAGPIGRLGVPFVVAAGISGEVGHFGVLDSAADRFPAVPAAER